MTKWQFCRFILFSILILSFSASIFGQVSLPDEITELSFSPDGAYIAVAGGSSGCEPEKKNDEYAVRILDALSGEIINRLIGHDCRLVAVDWSPDGSKIVSSSFDGLSIIWDVHTGEQIQYSRIRSEIGMGVSWSPNNSMIASIGNASNSALVWSANTGEVLFSLNHTALISSVSWKPDSNQIATSGLDNTIRIWDVDSQQNLLSLEASSQIYWIDWHPDGSQLASANRDGSIQIWDADSGEVLRTITVGALAVEIVLWSPTGEYLATVSNNAVQIWNGITGEQVEIFHYPEQIYTLDWSPDGQYLAFGGTSHEGQDARVQIENLDSLSLPTLQTLNDD